MQEHQRTRSVFVILAALIIGVALWRVLSYEPGARTKVAKEEKQSVSAAQETPKPVSKYDELIGEKTPAFTVKPTRAAQTDAPVYPSNQPVFITEKQPYREQAYAQAPRQPYPTRRNNNAGNGRVVNTNFYAPDRGEKPQRVSAPAANYTRTGGAAQPSVNWKNSAAVQEERAGRILAPFMRTNRKDRERMNAQWNKLSAAIDRAVFQALMPKSKKEAMIEKYAAKPSQTASDPVLQSSGLTGAFAPVGQAVSAQKQEIVKSFGSTFGVGAAHQAGRLMDAFASELGSALNTPGITQEQAAKRVQEISKKYQQKMNDLADKNQYDKFVADRQAQDNAQKEALHNLYPDGQVSEQINTFIDTASQKVQQLIKRTDLSPDEQSAQYAQIEQEKRDGIQNAILKSGQSLNPFYNWEQKQAQEDLAKLKEKIENGEVESVARVATPKETSTMKENVKAQRQGLEKGLLADPRFGQAAVEEVTPILDNYENQLNQLYTTELSPDERREKEVELLKNVNRGLLQKRMEQVQRMDIPDAQKQQALDEIQKAYDNIK